MSRIIDRALDIIGDHLKTQTSELPPTLEVKPGMAKGGHVNEKNKSNPQYHLDFHHDLMTIAGGTERMANMGAALYLQRVKDASKSGNTAPVEEYYEKKIAPILEKHGFPNYNEQAYGDAQREVKKMWRGEDEDDLRNFARGGRLLEDDYPTHYMPHVGRQVMADGGEPDPVSQALSVAGDVKGDEPIPAPTPRIPAPGAEGSVGRSKTLGESFANIPEGAPWAARSEEPANTPTIKSLAESFTNAIQNHASLPYKERVANTRAAIEKLAPYIGTRKDGKPIPLFGKNAKLMKSEKGYKGEKPVELEDGMGVETTGLALAPAFKMGNFNTCPNSASCKDECLGKTSGNYFALGGGQDLSEFKGPRLNSLNKTIAMIQEPEAFAIRLHDEIMSAKREAEYNGNHLGVRLNVLSDLHPSIHKALFEAHPDVDFYDYTKNNTDPVAPNHHYTYSSTGASQEGVDNPFSNWDRMRRRLDTGSNVAMAFSHKKHLPTEVHDEETGKTYKVINGDTHDFRPLDKVAEGEEGVIIGLKNKKGPSTNANAHIESNGFFVKYDPQEQMEGTGSKRKAVKDEDGDTIPTNFRAVIPVQKKRGKLT